MATMGTIQKCTEWDVEKGKCKQGHSDCGKYTDCMFSNKVKCLLIPEKDIDKIQMLVTGIEDNINFNDICIDYVNKIRAILEGDSNEG